MKFCGWKQMLDILHVVWEPQLMNESLRIEKRWSVLPLEYKEIKNRNLAFFIILCLLWEEIETQIEKIKEKGDVTLLQFHMLLVIRELRFRNRLLSTFLLLIVWDLAVLFFYMISSDAGDSLNFHFSYFPIPTTIGVNNQWTSPLFE